MTLVISLTAALQDPERTAEQMARLEKLMETQASIDLPFWMTLLFGMSLLPFLMTMVTSFAKIVIVLGILRQALGTPQTPPTSVITGIALVLTMMVMSPVVGDVWDRLEAHQELTPASIVESVEPPLRSFLERHSAEENVELFRDLRVQLGSAPAEDPAPAAGAIETLAVLVPAFVLTELAEAMQIGFLLFLPFLVVDLLVGNCLQALGMFMMSPLAISLPFKLLLFVSVDGWRLILQSVLLGYVG